MSDKILVTSRSGLVEKYGKKGFDDVMRAVQALARADKHRGYVTRLIFLDDQKAMRSLIHSSLVEMGCRNIRECPDGQEALMELHIRPAHLVISDMTMPNMDGLGLLSAIRDNPQLRTTA